MERFGFIHEKLDIKILILFLLRRLPGEVEPTTLGDLCTQCDSGIGYFDYSDCLSELMETGHIREGEEDEEEEDPMAKIEASISPLRLSSKGRSQHASRS